MRASLTALLLRFPATLASAGDERDPIEGSWKLRDYFWTDQRVAWMMAALTDSPA